MESLRWPEGGGGDIKFRGQHDSVLVSKVKKYLADDGNLICAQVRAMSVLRGSLHSNSTLISYAGF